MPDSPCKKTKAVPYQSRLLSSQILDDAEDRTRTRVDACRSPLEELVVGKVLCGEVRRGGCPALAEVVCELDGAVEVETETLGDGEEVEVVCGLEVVEHGGRGGEGLGVEKGGEEGWFVVGFDVLPVGAALKYFLRSSYLLMKLS